MARKILKYEKKRIVCRKNAITVQIKTVQIVILSLTKIKDASLIQGRLDATNGAGSAVHVNGDSVVAARAAVAAEVAPSTGADVEAARVAAGTGAADEAVLSAASAGIEEGAVGADVWAVVAA